MNPSVRNAVRRRARSRCEYCLLPECYATVVPFQIEHIIARQHGGRSTLTNLALACHRCNLHKGPNLTGIDPLSRRIVSLFHPRRMNWTRHFRWDGPLLIGRTAIGRATAHVLNMNGAERIDLRQSLIEEGVLPPQRE